MRKVDPVKYEQKRQQILAAAVRCFLRSGLKGASNSEICAEAGISPGHLYHYFDSKDAILAALAEAKLGELTAGLKQSIGDDISVFKIIRSQVESLTAPSWHRDEYALLFELMAEAVRNPTMAAILQQTNQAWRVLLTDVVRHGQQRGEIDSALDPEITAAGLIGIIDATKALALRDPKFNRSNASRFFELFVNRLLLPPASRTTKVASRSATKRRAKSG